MRVGVVRMKNYKDNEQGGDNGEKKEVGGGVGPPFVSVHADQERHGNQRSFPEHVEQEHVQRQENADHRRLQDQEENEELLYAIVDRLPGDQDAKRDKQSSEQHQPHGDTVHAQVITDSLADPGTASLE